MDPIAPLIAQLHAEGRPRVWSLVITIMGDAVQPRGGRIALARLQDLVARLGVEPGALRTALSRLVADGWLERDRNGRTSDYRLSASGRAEYGPAADRIYAPPAAAPRDWAIALMPDEAEGGIALGGGFRLLPAPAPDGAAIAVEGALRIDEAARERLCPPEFRAALARLFRDLETLAGTTLAPRDAMAARVLLIHRWRRIVLRHPELPDALLPHGLAAPRARVAAAYRRLLPASERWLDAGGAEHLQPLPEVDETLARRFAARPGVTAPRHGDGRD